MKMNSDMAEDLQRCKVSVTNSILTEPSLTDSQIKETMSMLKANKTYELWMLLRRHPSASRIAEYLNMMKPKEKPKDKPRDNKKNK